MSLESLKLPSENVRVELEKVTHSYSLPKAIISLLQTMYASVTLYRTRADQLERFGYAAFSLTVAPYAIMSAVNLLANIVSPDYSAIYIVESSVLKEAEKRDPKAFDGVVGRLVEEHKNHQDPNLLEVVITEVEPPEGYDLRPGEAGSGRVSKSPESRNLSETNGNELPNVIYKGSISGRSGGVLNEASTQRSGQNEGEEEAEKSRFGPFMFLPEGRVTDSHKKRCLEIPACPRFERKSDRSATWQLVDRYQEKSRFDWKTVQLAGIFVHFLVLLVIGLLSLIAVGCISRFKPGKSSVFERVVTMGWLAWGTTIGVVFGIFPTTQAGARRMVRSVGLFLFGKFNRFCVRAFVFFAGLPEYVTKRKPKASHQFLRRASSRSAVQWTNPGLSEGSINSSTLEDSDKMEEFLINMWKIEIFEVRTAFVISMLLSVAIPIAGFAVVGRMIRDEGRCLVLG